MLQERRYTLSELKNIIKESSDFKPKYGKKVANGDNSEKDKAAKELQKDVEKNQPKPNKVKNQDISNNGDFNRSLIDLRYMTEPSESYKARVEAQVKGFAGAREYEAHKNDEYGNADFIGNENFLQAAKKRSEEFNDTQNKIANSGLKSRELEKKGLGSKKQTVFDGKGEDENVVVGDNRVNNDNKEIENKAETKKLREHKMKVLNFKQTRFLSESQVIKRVPEEFKIDGNRFIMKDKMGTEYLMECRVDPTFGNKTVSILNTYNKQELKEEFNRIKSLYDYKSSNTNKVSSTKERLTENNEVGNMLDIMRKLTK